MARDRDLGVEAGSFTRLARALSAADGTQGTLREIVAQAARLVPATWAAAVVAERITSRPAAMAATTEDRVTQEIARIAGASGTSPGWRAFEEGVVCHVPDLAGEEGFGSYPRQMLARTPVRSVLAVPLRGREGVVGVLTLYGDQPRAFGMGEVERAVLLGTHSGIALVSASADDRAADLERALASSRTIGAAVGILVERHRLTESVAFDVLRRSSQLMNRKLADVAGELVECGALAKEEQAVTRTMAASKAAPVPGEQEDEQSA